LLAQHPATRNSPLFASNMQVSAPDSALWLHEHTLAVLTS